MLKLKTANKNPHSFKLLTFELTLYVSSKVNKVLQEIEKNLEPRLGANREIRFVH